MQDNVRSRCKQMIDELNIKVTRFTNSVGIGHSTYYKWINGELDLSQPTLVKIDSYLTRYGF